MIRDCDYTLDYQDDLRSSGWIKVFRIDILAVIMISRMIIVKIVIIIVIRMTIMMVRYDQELLPV